MRIKFNPDIPDVFYNTTQILVNFGAWTPKYNNSQRVHLASWVRPNLHNTCSDYVQTILKLQCAQTTRGDICLSFLQSFTQTKNLYMCYKFLFNFDLEFSMVFSGLRRVPYNTAVTRQKHCVSWTQTPGLE